MADTIRAATDPECAAFIMNALLLLGMGLALVFARQVNEYGTRLSWLVGRA